MRDIYILTLQSPGMRLVAYVRVIGTELWKYFQLCFYLMLELLYKIWIEIKDQYFPFYSNNSFKAFLRKRGLGAKFSHYLVWLSLLYLSQ